MTYYTPLFFAIVAVAALTTGILTPVARRLARRHGIVDRPDNQLKTQRNAVPYLGGAAVWGGILAALIVFWAFPAAYLSTPDRMRMIALLVGAILMAGLGLLDDLRNLSPLVKLGAQALVAVMMIKCDLHLQIVFLPMWINYALTIFWLVGITNAFNLIDIMDGLATGIAGISAVLFFLLAITTPGLDKTFVAVWGLALAGSLSGFIFFNFHPATIYLGDMGALSIGFLLGGLAISESYTSMTDLGLLIPLFILAIPLYDTFYVIILRILSRRSIMHGSRDHFALRLKALGLSVVSTVVLCYIISLMFGGIALFLSLSSGLRAQLLAGLMIIFALIGGILLKRVRME